MSRSGYTEDCNSPEEQWALIRWRGAVNSAMRGNRGQQLMRELAQSMDAMPEKELIADELCADGKYCALGVVGASRGIALDDIDPEDREQVARNFNIAPALAAEIVFENDEAGMYNETPAERWGRMRNWVTRHLPPN